MPSGERVPYEPPCAPHVPYARYVALGDSQTEGLGDGDETTGLRGWADRSPGTSRRQPRAPVRQSGRTGTPGRPGPRRAAGTPPWPCRPDLGDGLAGVNDLMRPTFDAAEAAGHLEAMFAALTATGARVATVTFPDIGKIMPLARPLAPRVHDLNARIRAAAARHRRRGRRNRTAHLRHGRSRLERGPAPHQPPRPRTDRGGRGPRAPASRRHDAWTRPLPPLPAPTGWQAANAELRWAAAFLGPWLGRRLRGRSSGDGRTAKRPQLLPVRPAP